MLISILTFKEMAKHLLYFQQVNKYSISKIGMKENNLDFDKSRRLHNVQHQFITYFDQKLTFHHFYNSIYNIIDISFRFVYKSRQV